MKKTIIPVTVTALTLGIASFALAGEASACEGKNGARFEKADANGDGFLTAGEVGDERWARIKVADANNDGAVSKDEIKQAKADGKLKRRGKRKQAA